MKIQFQNTPDNTIEQISSNRQRAARSSVQGSQSAPDLFQGAFRIGGDSMDKMIADGRFAGIDSMAGLQSMIGAVDGKVQQDYMTLMSNTLSDEDYGQLVKDGFSPKDMHPQETVTILDKIKAELARAGKQVAGYNDDLDPETLEAALGSQVLAQEVSKSFSEADLPLSEDMTEELGKAWEMASSLSQPSEGAIQYMLRGNLEPRIVNFYMAENSGAGVGNQNSAMFYESGVQGYYAQAGELPEVAEMDEGFREQVDQVIAQAGLELSDENRELAKWLLDKNLPLTAEKMEQYKNLTEVSFPVSEQNFAEAAAGAVAEGRNPKYGDLSGEGRETIYKKAGRLMEDRRILEEVRLHMTAEVNVKLLRSGFAIDTAPMEELVEALKAAEKQVAESYFPEAEDPVSKYRTLREAEQVIGELPQMPAKLLGVIRTEGAGNVPQPEENSSPSTLRDVYQTGREMQREMEAAREKYETLMTAPRTDLGDSIRKAFANVDDILSDLGYEISEENQKAVRVLGYNRMDLTPENIDRVREAQRVVTNVIEKMTPASVLKMIRDDVNPLEKSFEELETYFDDLPEEYQEASESYSRFLYRLEQRNDITPEERSGYIGIYRMLHQIEKRDGAAVGMVLNTGAQLQFDNLLSAARTGNFRFMDVRLGEEEKTYASLVKDENGIDSQIEAAYRRLDMEDIREAGKVSGEASVLLEKAGILPTAGYLLAAQELMSEGEMAVPEEKLHDDREDGEEQEEELWRHLGEEDFPEKCREELERLESFAREQTFETDRFLDVRQMQMLAKQFHIAKGLAAGGEEFYLPLEIDGKTGKLHLTVEHAEGEAGKVTVEVNALGGRTRAEFRLREGRILATLWGDGEEEVMKLSKAADIFHEYLGEETEWRLDGSPTIIDSAKTADRRTTVQRTRNRSGELMSGNAVREERTDGEKQTGSQELLRLARTWIRAVTQKEVAYEN